ncbi:MAG: ATP cone domain-containing protein [Patescibacteria group bacterium]|nr:ATP cone domain-containing protein [Patescibacteria group bacterium]
MTIELIQENVEKELMTNAPFEVAKEFILYRNDRKKVRVKNKEKVEKKLEQHTLKIKKSN